MGVILNMHHFKRTINVTYLLIERLFTFPKFETTNQCKVFTLNKVYCLRLFPTLTIQRLANYSSRSNGLPFFIVTNCFVHYCNLQAKCH